MAPVLVSVIMPAYNAANYVRAAIESVAAQTFPEWELIVVDDGSTDATARIVQEAARADDRIKYVYQQNGKQGKARNTAIANSRGDLLAFLDADDLWVEQKLELQVAALQEMKADVVYSTGSVFSEDVDVKEKPFPMEQDKNAGSSMFDLLFQKNSIPILSVLMRREIFAQVGGFEEGLEYQGCEDYDLWLKAAKQGAVFYGMPDMLFRYRRHASATTNKDSNWLRPMLRVVQRHFPDSTLRDPVKKQRVRKLYRELIAALLTEGNTNEARAYMSELAAWDKSSLVTSIQSVLMKIAPPSFNSISRVCLYRIEWHLGRLTGRERGNC